MLVFELRCLLLIPVSTKPTDDYFFKHIGQHTVGDHNCQQKVSVADRELNEVEHLRGNAIESEDQIDLEAKHEDDRHEVDWVGPDWLPKRLGDAEAQTAADVLDTRQKIKC